MISFIANAREQQVQSLPCLLHRRDEVGVLLGDTTALWRHFRNSEVARADGGHLRAESGQWLGHRTRGRESKERRDAKGERNQKGQAELGAAQHTMHLIHRLVSAPACVESQRLKFRLDGSNVLRRFFQHALRIRFAPHDLPRVGGGDAHFQGRLPQTDAFESQSFSGSQQISLDGITPELVRLIDQCEVVLLIAFVAGIEIPQARHQFAQDRGGSALGEVGAIGQ